MRGVGHENAAETIDGPLYGLRARLEGEGGQGAGLRLRGHPGGDHRGGGRPPYRIKAFGHPDTELGDAYLARFNCRFCRSCLQLGLEGSYDFLDGLLETNGCDHLRGMFENWQHVKTYDFFHYLKVPHFLRDDSLEYFVEELALDARRHRGVLRGERSPTTTCASPSTPTTR